VDEALVELGHTVVVRQKLRDLRNILGISRTSMADLLHTSRVIYNHWEDSPSVNLRVDSAERIGRFYRHATAQLAALSNDGIKIAELIPVHLVSTQLGVGQEVLLKRYRQGMFNAEDLGLLGLWLYRDELTAVAGTL
jgi:DNA-binding XRE family transcriptional regulator